MPSDKLDANCTFCKILRDPTGDHIVYEDGFSLAFLDHRPLFPGHCLVIPRSRQSSKSAHTSQLHQVLGICRVNVEEGPETNEKLQPRHARIRVS